MQSQCVLFPYADAFKQLNQSADPCTDFYEYACGGWEDENALETGETSVTGFSLVREKSYNILKDVLANAKTNYSDVRKNVCLTPSSYLCELCLTLRLVVQEKCEVFVGQYKGSITFDMLRYFIQNQNRLQNNFACESEDSFAISFLNT